MEQEKAKRVVTIINWVRFIILVAFLTLIYAGLVGWH